MAIKIWSVGEGVDAADINTNFEETIEGRASYAVATGSANAYVVDLPFDLGSFVAGQEFSFKANFTNTGPCTANPDALGAKSIRKNGSQYLDAGDIINGQIVTVRYDGTNLQMVSTPATSLRGFSFGFSRSSGVGGDYAGSDCPCGYAGANSLAFCSFNSGSGDGSTSAVFCVASDVGLQPYLKQAVGYAFGNISTRGVTYTGTDWWHSTSDNDVKKNNTSVSIASGGSVNGPLGIDITNSYLLMLTSSTNIRRWTGIAGTTITQHSNITLDTAITAALGFIYDEVNQQYMCIDTTNDVIRRFNSSGTTVDTTAYSIPNEDRIVGLHLVARRVYIVVQSSGGGVDEGDCSMDIQYLPTALVI